ncbi:hypothetical protein M5D96_005705, partial [Drosophila gunungcola]
AVAVTVAAFWFACGCGRFATEHSEVFFPCECSVYVRTFERRPIERFTVKMRDTETGGRLSHVHHQYHTEHAPLGQRNVMINFSQLLN